MLAREKVGAGVLDDGSEYVGDAQTQPNVYRLDVRHF